MSNVTTSAGTTIAISATQPATYNQIGFAALTFTNIGEVTNLGEFGRVYEQVTHQPLGDRRTVKRKGSFNDGALSLQIGRDEADAGQALLLTALDDDNSQAFEVTYQDGTIKYFTAQVMSFTDVVNDANTITGHNCQVEIDNDIIDG
jgi:hypothetical protein